MLPATHLEPGVVVQKCHPTPGILDIGRLPDGVDDTAAAISADLRGAGFESVPRPDIMAWKYRKLLLNLGERRRRGVPAGDAADELDRPRPRRGRGRHRGGRHRRRQRGAGPRAARRHPPAAAVRPAPQGGSTWQSIARGTDSEIDYLSGEIVLLGRLHGVPTPVNELLQRVTTDLARGGGAARSRDAAAALADLG